MIFLTTYVSYSYSAVYVKRTVGSFFLIVQRRRVWSLRGGTIEGSGGSHERFCIAEFGRIR